VGGSSTRSVSSVPSGSGHREGSQLLDLVAEELDAHGVLGHGREDIQDAPAHRELAAPRHHVDTRVGQLDQAGRHVHEVVAATAALEHHRLDVGQPSDQGLQRRARPCSTCRRGRPFRTSG
jgi:hypothetical protein